MQSIIWGCGMENDILMEYDSITLYSDNGEALYTYKIEEIDGVVYVKELQIDTDKPIYTIYIPSFEANNDKKLTESNVQALKKDFKQANLYYSGKIRLTKDLFHKFDGLSNLSIVFPQNYPVYIEDGCFDKNCVYSFIMPKNMELFDVSKSFDGDKTFYSESYMLVADKRVNFSYVDKKGYTTEVSKYIPSLDKDRALFLRDKELYVEDGVVRGVQELSIEE